MRALAFATFVFMINSSALAAIKVTAVAGDSANNITTATTTTSPTIYGGVAGDAAFGTACSSADTLTPCDGCATATGLFVCNRKRIDSTLRLRISFTSDTATGRPLMVRSSDGVLVDSEVGTVQKGNTATVDVPWGTVCSNMTTSQSGTCRDGTTAINSGTFKVGIDVNGNGQFDSGDDSTTINVQILDPDPANAGGIVDTIDDCTTTTLPGICGFTAYPGDKKIFLDNATGGSGFPTTVTGTISKINVYYLTTTWITSPSQATPKSLTVEPTETGYDIVNKVIDGLTNSLAHYFRVSVSDPAGNEMFFTSDASITANCAGVVPPATPTPPFDGTNGGQLCPFAAIPDEVVGLLTEDLNCFVATAVFGSPFHWLVADLRALRDAILKPTTFGRELVAWYYDWGPSAAAWLKENSWAKPMVRALLVSVWLGGMAILWWPIPLILVLIGFALWHRRSREMRV